MFCRVCGHNFENDAAAVCPVCGTAVDQPQAAQAPVQEPAPAPAQEYVQAPAQEYVQAPVQPAVEGEFVPAPKKPRKKISKKVLIRLGAALVSVALVVGVVGALFGKEIKNTLAKTFQSTPDYLMTVYEDSLKETLTDVFGITNIGSSILNEKSGSTASAKVTIGPSMEELYDIAGINQKITLDKVEQYRAYTQPSL